MRNPTTWFQLGIIGYAGPEITNGLRAFPYVARSRPGSGRAFSLASAKNTPASCACNLAQTFESIARPALGVRHSDNLDRRGVQAEEHDVWETLE